MIDFIKSFGNLSNFFLAWTILIVLSYFLKKQRIFKILCYSGFILFFICSTSYIPKKLLGNLESTWSVLEPHSLDTAKQYYIHVLGAGYSLDERLPAVSKLETISLARLTEGIRIFRQLPGSILVTSGHSSLGLESQASVTQKAAVELGVPIKNIRLLETPSTTLEEAIALRERFDVNINVIIVTDAAHMPRAVKIYKASGFETIAAPTNFKVKFDPNSYNGFTLPSLQSIQIMDHWIREKLAVLKLAFTDLGILE